MKLQYKFKLLSSLIIISFFFGLTSTAVANNACELIFPHLNQDHEPNFPLKITGASFSRRLAPLTEELAGQQNIAKLTTTWSAVYTRAKRFNWLNLTNRAGQEPSVNSVVTQINRRRRDASNTMNERMTDRPDPKADRDIGAANWIQAEYQVRLWVFQNVHPNSKNIRILNAILRKNLYSFGRTPGYFRDYDFPEQFGSYEASAIPSAMRELDNWYYTQTRTKINPIELATRYAVKLVTIHPFTDGNGRTSRLVLDWLLQLNHFPPASFSPNQWHIARNQNGGPSDVSIATSLERVTVGISNTLQILEQSGL